MNAQVKAWIVFALTRGIAWMLAGKLGMEAAKADSLAANIAEALCALAIAAATVYTSVHGRKTLLATTPPALLDLESLMEGTQPPPEFKGNGMGVPGTQKWVRLLLWFGQDVQADMDRLAAKYHDWAYLTGGNPKLSEVNAWRDAYARNAANPRSGYDPEADRSFFAGGEEMDKLRVDGHLELNARMILWNRWTKWKYLLLNRLYVGAVFDAVRDLGEKAFNYKKEN
jgi:hypothetical protein